MTERKPYQWTEIPIRSLEFNFSATTQKEQYYATPNRPRQLSNWSMKRGLNVADFLDDRTRARPCIYEGRYYLANLCLTLFTSVTNV